ncbi:MAG: hypothetical protein IBX68_12565 [Dehalococcoidia bacterium]|nr:hypothetical protein [Dehalococcoidia bacterium]
MEKKSGWRSSKRDETVHCAAHRRYFSAGAGCPICAFERLHLRQNPAADIPRLQKCPVCGETTLFWYQCSNRCECLNVDCKLKLAEPGYQ